MNKYMYMVRAFCTAGVYDMLMLCNVQQRSNIHRVVKASSEQENTDQASHLSKSDLVWNQQLIVSIHLELYIKLVKVMSLATIRANFCHYW